MKKRIFRISGLASALLLASFISPMLASGETLHQALKAAYENNDLLAQSRASLRASDEDYVTAGAGLRPVISYALGAMQTIPAPAFQPRETVSTATLSARWQLFDFSKTALDKESTAELIGAARQTLLALEQTVFINAAQAYFSYFFGLDTIALAENNLALIDEHLRAARERFSLGSVTRTDVAQAEARLAQAQATIALARGNGEIARQAYQLVIGHAPSNKPSRTKLPPLPFNSVEAARKHAFRTHPTIKAQQHLVKARGLMLAGAEIAWRPTLDLSTSVSRDDVRARKINQSLSLTLSGTIYNGGRRASSKRKAVARHDAEMASLHLITKQISQGVANAWARYEIARQQQRAAEQSVKANEIAYEGVDAEAELGVRTTLDVLNAEQALLDAKTNLIKAKAGLSQSYYALLAATGLLTVSGLKLDLAQYDPEANFLAQTGKKLPRVGE